MSTLTQTVAVTLLNLKNIPSRWGPSLVAIVGAAGVVGVLVAILAMKVGFERTMAAAGREDNAVLMRPGATSEMSSGYGGDAVNIVETLPGIGRRDQSVLVAPQLVTILDIDKISTDQAANVNLRGITPALFKILDEFEIVDGRLPEAGRREIIVGRQAQSQFKNMAIGDVVGDVSNQWTVVGVFSDGGSVRESEVWADATVVQSAFNRGNGYSSMLVKLASADSLAVLQQALEAEKRVQLRATRETDFYARQSNSLKTMISTLGYIVTIVMALGAFFASLNTMYSAIDSRAREIGTLRALGFGGQPIVASVMLEAVALTLVGGLIGGGLAYALFNGMTVSALNFDSFSQVAFAFNVSPALMVQGIVIAVLIGVFGGLFPAVRATRIPVTEALREL